jgi:glycosyltransferase involved in cell wall biosynthesis
VKSRILTVIPVFNGAEFIAQTLDSVARQTLRPDRVVVLDNCSTDRTPEIVKNFAGIRCEFIRNEKNLGLFGNLNRALDFSTETEFLQLLHADDTIAPEFYEAMTRALADCAGRGMAWSLDERIDENNRHISFSGMADGKTEVLAKDVFLQRKAELGNQAFCAVLVKTGGLPPPCRFREDFPIMGDTVFWAAYGAHCEKIVHVRRALAKYRWHGSNQTVFLAPGLQPLIYDEWRTMEINELLRGKGWSLHRKLKLKGLFAVRSGIKSKRIRQNGNSQYAREIAQAARGITGWPLWLSGQVLVELRDFYLFRILGRQRHPKNIYG